LAKAKAVRPFAEKMITLGKPVEMDGGFVALKRAEVENG
jgi:ribosomal protein L17